MDRSINRFADRCLAEYWGLNENENESIFGCRTRCAFDGRSCDGGRHAVKAPIAPPVIPYSWTGFYVGANVGYSWGRASTDFAATNLALVGLSGFSQSQHLNGVIGGGQLGYNWQANNQWVFGLEADFQGSGEKASDPRAPLSFDIDFNETTITATVNQTLEAKIKWFGTVRGRVGYLVTPTVLLYGTGGACIRQARSKLYTIHLGGSSRHYFVGRWNSRNQIRLDGGCRR